MNEELRGLDPPTRSTMHKLADHIEQVAVWYAGQDLSDRLRWKHPQTIVKALMEDPEARHYVAGGLRHNKPPASRSSTKKKPSTTAEEERLRALLISVIRRLMKFDPEAEQLLDKVMPQPDPSDSIEDI